MNALDWSRVLRLAKSTGSMRILFVGLSLARELLGLDLPGAVTDRMESDVRVKALAGRISPQVLSDNSHPGENGPLFFIELRERLRDQARVMTHYLYIATVSKDDDAPLVDLHGFLKTVRHITAPLRFVRKYI
jgi:hypothetical protein